MKTGGSVVSGLGIEFQDTSLEPSIEKNGDISTARPIGFNEPGRFAFRWIYRAKPTGSGPTLTEGFLA